MNVLFGNDGIVVEDAKTIPSSLELCRMDKRLLYIGTVPDSQGNRIQNAFLHVLVPNMFYTIEEAKLLKEKLLLLKTKMHYFDKKSKILDDMSQLNHLLIIVSVCLIGLVLDLLLKFLISQNNNMLFSMELVHLINGHVFNTLQKKVKKFFIILTQIIKTFYIGMSVKNLKNILN